MNILMIAPEPFFEPRGTPISVHDRLIGLSRLGHQVDLLTYHIGEDVTIPGVNIHRIPSVPLIKTIRVGPSWKKLFLDFILLIKSVQMLRNKSYHVIHSHEEAAFFAMFLAKFFSTKHLYDRHSSLSGQLANSRFGYLKPVVWLFEILENAVFKTCDALISISCDLYTDAKKVNPTINQILIENVAIELTRSKFAPKIVEKLNNQLNLNGKLPVVYTGTLEIYQGLEMMLEGVARVKFEFPQVAFIIVGGQPEQVEVLKSKARLLGIEDCLYFTGVVPLEESLAYLTLAQVLVSPRIQGLSVPLKIYSYLNAGKPIVATRLPAHTQVLTDEIACLVDPNPEAFADGILRLLREPEWGDSLGRNAVRYVKERQSLDDYMAKIEQIYLTLDNDATAGSYLTA